MSTMHNVESVCCNSMSHSDIIDYAVHSLEESRVILDVSRLIV